MTGNSGTPRPTGVAFGAGAYLCWGLFPAFFALLRPSGAIEILAHRVLWTCILMILVLMLTRRLGSLRGLAPRTWLLVASASALISLNWGTYIYGVVSGRVVETALGYFINPLVSVLLGVVIFRERMTRAQLVALAIAASAVVVLTVDYGHPPLIALTLAFSFALYGLVKKVIPLDPRTSVTAEGLVGVPFAIGYLVVLQTTSAATFLTEGPGHALLIALAGPVTAVPLLLFGAAAQRVPLVTMGLLQYLTPALQMAWGVLVVHEDMPGSRWIGFTMIWIALAVFTTDALMRFRRSRRGTEVPPATGDEVLGPAK